ncbi:membrane protein insertase YidC [Bifidobacterium leontopitheci]|uniref:Membrane protein insertase YidC n=1 Tax=Bifidobacterium leontopitheci TaxID=2650774 RepID=A0A6I1GLT3_9BIFI|nr:membrane protein insertase YidC [Bifidobacterium leontopitheci]KAB7790359.1 60Kd inner membrane protein [Bifidobacterium leontopitheci]
MNTSDQFLLDNGFWGWLYKLLTPLEWLMTQIMVGFHKFLTMLGMSPIGFSWVLSIIVLVLVVHACILPIFIKQMKGMRKMQALQPKMQHIQNKYKGKKDQASKEAMSREMMKLYQENDANPMDSCWTMVIQGPVFMCMFYMLSAIPYIARGKRAALGAFDQATAEQFAQTRVFGVSVTDTLSTANPTGKIIIGVFIFLMCACMWFMQFNNMRKNLPKASMQGSAYKMQQAMTWGFPIMYIFSGVMFPFAVLVYWLTNNACNLLRSLFTVYAFPTPGSPAAEEKEIRDHKRENARRAKAGQMSLEEEQLENARKAAEEREARGYQRQQPQRKNRKAKKK